MDTLAQVTAMADELTARYDRLDVLVDNAGNQFGTMCAEPRRGTRRP